MQIRHAIKCKRCLDTIESKGEHDLKFCSCLAVGVDGGNGGNRILGNQSDMENRSMYVAFIQNKMVWLPESIVQSLFHKHQALEAEEVATG